MKNPYLLSLLLVPLLFLGAAPTTQAVGPLNTLNPSDATDPPPSTWQLASPPNRRMNPSVLSVHPQCLQCFNPPFAPGTSRRLIGEGI